MKRPLNTFALDPATFFAVAVAIAIANVVVAILAAAAAVAIVVNVPAVLLLSMRSIGSHCC